MTLIVIFQTRSQSRQQTLTGGVPPGGGGLADMTHHSQSVEEMEAKMNDRIVQLEQENKRLSESSRSQQHSYEKCLNEVTEKVHTAITAQKVTLIF